MNLIHASWLKVSSLHEYLGPTQLAVRSSGAVDVVAPRADFRAALYQFLIGLLQTCFAPEDREEWSRRFTHPPSSEELQQAFAPWADAFELDSANGPAFMQDLDPMLHAEPVEIARLLIDTPGDKTVADNNDLFIHGGTVRQMCPRCSAMALFTLQINAPSGGAGHRVSLRGGGPLTTLRVPRMADATLWQKLWSNVLPVSEIPAPDRSRRSDVMPWLGPTRTSDSKGVGDTTPLDAHPLQAYWSMPRRIRLDWSTASEGNCDLCGEHSERCLRHYRTRPYGVNYTGAWMHPLTPYFLDSKQANLPISIKGQKGGIGYRQWLGLAIGDGQTKAARVVEWFNGTARLPEPVRDARLWCFGYDMDNMKARCWYDATLPLPDVEPEHLAELTDDVHRILDVANDMASAVRKQTGAAIHPEGTGDPVVSQSFWQNTEAAFYEFLRNARKDVGHTDSTARASEVWLRTARGAALRIFDERVFAAPVGQEDMERVVKARAGLERMLHGGSCRKLADWIRDFKEAEA